MVSKSDIRDHFKLLPKTQQNIISYCKEQYETLARIRGDLFVPNYLEKLVRQVCQALGLSNPTRDKILRGLFHVMLAYRVRAGMQTNKAPIFHPRKHLQLISYLWFNQTQSLETMFKYKTTAVQALLCLYSFRRWIDVSRIRWEHCSRISNNGRIFLKFTLAASKTNCKGKRDEFVTLQQNDTDLCPVKILNQYWRIRGAPKTGFVLPCVHREREFNFNNLFPEWDAYVCKGHTQKQKEKIPCLGEINGRTSFGFYRRAARKNKWKVLPHSHSFRRGGIIIANKLNMPRERITEYFGWKHDSEMISLYTNNELTTTSQGLAWKFSDALIDNLTCLNDISFTE